jgi:hypothetical protein
MASFPFWELMVFLAAGPPGTALLVALSAAVGAELARRSGPPGLG